MFSHKKFHDDAIHIFSKLPHVGADQIISSLKKNEITLHDLFTHILTDEKINECIKITHEAFNKNKVTMTLLYETETYLQELASIKKLFLSKSLDKKEESNISLDQIDLTHVLAPPPIQRLFPHNRYYDVLGDIKSLHHVKHYQPSFINFTKTTLEMMDEIIRMTKDNTQNLFFYLLANIHQYINMYFSPKRKSTLFSILTTLKGNRFNNTSEFYAVKAVLQMIIRLQDPEFKTLIANSDFEDVAKFQQQLIKSTNFDLLDKKNVNENQKKALKYIQKKEAKYSRLLLDIHIEDKQTLKLALKLGALHYAKEKILMGEPAPKIIFDIKIFFGEAILKHRFKQKKKLQKMIEKLQHNSRRFSIFQDPIAKEDKISQKTLSP